MAQALHGGAVSGYRIVAYPVKLPRTGVEWNPITVEETLYRVEGPGVDRPATDIEIDVWRQGIYMDKPGPER